MVILEKASSMTSELSNPPEPLTILSDSEAVNGNGNRSLVHVAASHS